MATLFEVGAKAFRSGRPEEALAALAEAVRRSPSDHRARILAARALAQLGEPERALTVLDTAAEGLLRRDYLLSAIAAIKLALRFNPAEKRLKTTLRRIHARASAAVGRPAVPPPPPEPLFEKSADVALLSLRGSELADRAYEVLLQPDEGAVADPNARPPLPLFADLDADAFVELVERMSYRELQPGEEVVAEGQEGDSLFVVVAGALRIERHVEGVGRWLGSLKAGSLFGELALLTGAPRSATISAAGEVELFEVSRDDIDFVATSHPTIQKALGQFAQRRIATNLVSTSALFQAFPAEKRAQAFRRFEINVVNRGERLITEGRPASGLFLVVAGEFSVVKKDPAGGELLLGLLRDGDLFGEISLLSGDSATANVSATRKSVVATLPRAEFEELAGEVPEIEDYLLELSRKRLGAIAESMKPAEVIDAEDLVIEI